jgi:hypothetical protein
VILQESAPAQAQTQQAKIVSHKATAAGTQAAAAGTGAGYYPMYGYGGYMSPAMVSPMMPYGNTGQVDGQAYIDGLGMETSINQAAYGRPDVTLGGNLGLSGPRIAYTAGTEPGVVGGGLGGGFNGMDAYPGGMMMAMPYGNGMTPYTPGMQIPGTESSIRGAERAAKAGMEKFVAKESAKVAQNVADRAAMAQAAAQGIAVAGMTQQPYGYPYGPAMMQPMNPMMQPMNPMMPMQPMMPMGR